MNSAALSRHPFRKRLFTGASPRRLAAVGIVLAAWWAMCWFGAGYYFDGQADNAVREESRRADGFVGNTSRGINRLLSVRYGVPVVLARDGAVRRTLRAFGPDVAASPLSSDGRKRMWLADPSLAEMSRLLDLTAADLAVRKLFLLNAAGDCVASSSVAGETSPVGESYADRGYFQAARHGLVGKQFAVGRVNEARSLRVAAPVMENGRFIGAVVARIDLSQFADRINQADAFLTDKQGVVVLARDKHLEMQAVPGAAVAALDAGTRTALYKRTLIPSLPLSGWDDARHPELMRLEGRGQPLLLRTQALPADGLAMTVLWPVPQVVEFWEQHAYFSLASGFIGSLLIVIGMGATRYVRDMRASRHALARREREFRSLAENLPDNVVRWDTEGRYLYINPTHERTLGRSLDEVAGTVIPDSHEQVKAAIARVVATGQAIHAVRQPVVVDGLEELHDVSLMPEFDEMGKVVSVLGMGRDMTEVYRMQEALAAREQEFRSLAESSPDFIFRYDREGRIRYFNGVLLRFLGLASADGVIGRTPGEVWPDGRFADIEAAAARCVASGEATRLELIIPQPDGDLLFHHASIVPERNEAGEIVGTIGFGRDITGIKRTETALRASEEVAQSRSGLLNAIIESSPEVIVFALDKEYRYLAFNRKHREVMQAIWGRQIAVGMNMLDVIGNHPDREAAKGGMDRALAGESFVLEEAYGDEALSRMYWRNHWSPIRSAAGEVIGLTCFVMNITERKRAEGALARSEQEFRTLAANLPVAVIRYDAQQRRLYLNPAAERMLRGTADELLGQVPGGPTVPATPAMLARYRGKMDEVLASDSARELEFVLDALPRDEQAHYEVRFVPEHGADGQPAGVLAIWYDITERKRMEEALAAREQEFRSLAESSPDYIIRYDIEGRIRYLNGALARRLGLSSDADVIGKRPSEVWPDDRFAAIERAAAWAVENASATLIELVAPTEDGAMSVSHIHVVPERDLAGEIVGTIAFGRDITAIREAERRLKHFIDNLPGLAYTFRLSPDGRACFPYVSAAIKELYGLKPDDVKEDMAALHMLVYPDDRPRIEAAIAASARDMTLFRIESRICRPGHPERWIDVRSVPERQADGGILWYGLMLDITERKQAEERLKAAHAFTQRIIDAIPDPIFVKDRQHRWLLMNDACGVMIGHPREALVGKSDHDFLPAEQADIFWEKDELVFASRRENLNEEPITDGSGALRWLQTKKVIASHEGGDILVGVIRDITERKRMENELRKEADFQRVLLDALVAVGIQQMVIENGRIVHVGNRALAHRLGFTDAYMDGHPPLAEIIHPDDRARVMDYYRRRMAGEPVPNAYELRLQSPDGRSHEYETAVAVLPGTDPVRIISVGRDISERKAIETARETALAEAMRLAQMRSAFLAQMSHELRTPLNGILGFAQLLQMDGAMSEAQREWLNIIQQSGDHLLALINQVLDFAKIEADKLDLNLGDIKLDTFLGSVVGIIGVKAEQKKLALVYEADADLPHAIRGDELRLRQVLLNLLANAVKFTDRGQVALRVGCPAPGRVRFEVQDSGVGIAEDQLESIFQPFEQAGEASRRTAGTGLGLAISRKLVRLMGGDIEVVSRPGEGSLFSFELDMEVVESGPMEPDTGAEQAAQALPAVVVEPLFVPPAPELEILHGLARRGNMRSIAQRAAYLSELDARYAAFADQLGQMAKAYQSKAIVDFVEHYLGMVSEP
jgi:PAS domain S-box-containing protein